ncbi:MAG: nucleoside deaminase [Candidatus Omnitrophota bacterium]
MTNEHFMKLAIDKAREGIDEGQTPFGAVIVKDGGPVACSHNVVWKTMDITAHGEINCIRAACRTLNTIDLSGCVIYSTCEPCPMCFSAIHWARIGKIFYGAGIDDAREAGFHELEIANEEMKRIGQSPIEIIGGILKDECSALFDYWKRKGGRPY